MNPMRLGDLLRERSLIGAEDLSRALAVQSGHGGRLGAVLVKMGSLSEAALYEVLSDQLGYPVQDATALDLDAVDAACRELSCRRDWLLDRRAVPVRVESGSIAIACCDPLDPELRETLQSSRDGLPLLWRLLPDSQFERTASRLRERTRNSAGLDAAQLRELAEDAPVIAFVNNVLAQAVDARASDVHLEPGEQEFAVRLRVDGVLSDHSSAPMHRYAAVASRIKLVAQLDIAERRLPQDGRVSVRAAGQEMDVRVSVIPAVYGESIVMRLLPKQRADLRLERLGMSPVQLQEFRRWLGWPNGLLLVTGPTGSGKSTTLYGALASITDSTRKLVTVEDPVEFRLPHVVQIQTQAEIGYTFARALRSILRHDPDIVMVGEIRDRETAEIAMQAALTGHLVLATLHTNDALSAITRLTDMGIEPYLVAAALRATLAQRLVRRLCEQCAVPAEPPALQQHRLERAVARRGGPAQWRRPVGCPHCNGSGFRGRIGIYELVTLGANLQHGIAAGEPLAQITAQADREGRVSLIDDGLTKVAQGHTTYDEVLRAAGSLGDD
jgi:general secretion pathway protein E